MGKVIEMGVLFDRHKALNWTISDTNWTKRAFCVSLIRKYEEETLTLQQENDNVYEKNYLYSSHPAADGILYDRH